MKISETAIDEKTEKTTNKWIDKVVYPITLSFFIVSICILVIIASIYFFVTFAADKFGVFVKDIPEYKATLLTVLAIATTYIVKKFK
ncbi:MAG: hypothetical protein IMZ60_02555 [Actinobacteria bacterium]|nr:hypothetical protein [Actinomycetota bacterium]